jgi:ABC-2 type transport system ATP-binding protein
MAGNDFFVANDICKNFGRIRVLNGVNCSIAKGTIAGIIGPNGSGKTTFLRIISTLLRPSSGDFQIQGVSGLKKPLSVRKRLAFCPEQLPIDGQLTGYDFLDFCRRLYGKKDRDLRRILQMINLGEAIERPVKTYSTGMKKRISVGRLLLIDPEVFVFDEPTAGLDPGVQKVVHNILLDLKAKNKVVLLSSHNLYEITRICDVIYSMRDGQLSKVDSVTDAFQEEVSEILELVLKAIEPGMIKRIIATYPQLQILSTDGQKARFSVKGSMDKDDFVSFLHREGMKVREIKYM